MTEQWGFWNSEHEDTEEMSGAVYQYWGKITKGNADDSGGRCLKKCHFHVRKATNRTEVGGRNQKIKRSLEG